MSGVGPGVDEGGRIGAGTDPDWSATQVVKYLQLVLRCAGTVPAGLDGSGGTDPRDWLELVPTPSQGWGFGRLLVILAKMVNLVILIILVIFGQKWPDLVIMAILAKMVNLVNLDQMAQFGVIFFSFIFYFLIFIIFYFFFFIFHFLFFS